MKKVLTLMALALVVTACTPSYTDPKPPRPIKGSPEAQVVVEEFADFQCPACGAAYPVLKQLQERFGNRVLWKYYHFPLFSIHPYAFNASLASECANDQGKFWEYHDMLYENQKNLKTNDLYSYAEKLGLDVELFKACFKSRAKTTTVRRDMAEANARGVNSTPSIFLNGQLTPDWTSLDTRLSALLPSVGTSSSTPTP